MKKFVQVAKDLQMKKLAKNITMSIPPEYVDDLENNDHIYNEDIHTDNENQVENEYAGGGILDIADAMINLDIPGSDELGSGIQSYKCKKCEASYKSKQALKYHTNSKHDGIRYSCNQCEYQATQKGNLKIHKKSVHEGIEYSCNQCDYHFIHLRNLKKHKKSVHEGIRYSCNQCEYQLTQKGNLKIHKKSTHEGIKYSCNQC